MENHQKDQYTHYWKRENIFEEIIFEKFPNVSNEIDILIQESQESPVMINQEKPTLRHTRIKLSKVKNKEKKILKATNQRKATYHTKKSSQGY